MDIDRISNILISAHISYVSDLQWNSMRNMTALRWLLIHPFHRRGQLTWQRGSKDDISMSTMIWKLRREMFYDNRFHTRKCRWISTENFENRRDRNKEWNKPSICLMTHEWFKIKQYFITLKRTLFLTVWKWVPIRRRNKKKSSPRYSIWQMSAILSRNFQTIHKHLCLRLSFKICLITAFFGHSQWLCHLEK